MLTQGHHTMTIKHLDKYVITDISTKIYTELLKNHQIRQNAHKIPQLPSWIICYKSKRFSIILIIIISRSFGWALHKCTLKSRVFVELLSNNSRKKGTTIILTKWVSERHTVGVLNEVATFIYFFNACEHHHHSSKSNFFSIVLLQ